MKDNFSSYEHLTITVGNEWPVAIIKDKKGYNCSRKFTNGLLCPNMQKKKTFSKNFFDLFKLIVVFLKLKKKKYFFNVPTLSSRSNFSPSFLAIHVFASYNTLIKCSAALQAFVCLLCNCSKFLRSMTNTFLLSYHFFFRETSFPATQRRLW